ncbi:MAG: ribosome biogenesis GTP-binding protein YihA/YsxC [bacterium]
MNVNNVELTAVCGRKDQYPVIDLPEIAFVGKSNVGKSSLINCMVNRKALARTSQNPGKTRTINFYNVENNLLFVDLPGYGYARASKSEIEKWGKMIEDYICDREQLKGVILLVDIRHEAGKNDIMMYDWLKHYNYKVIVVATKSDKLKKSQINKHLAVLKKTLNLQKDDMLIPFSSEKKDGKDSLWQEIENKIYN